MTEKDANKKPFIVVVEGIDGSGKTTLVQQLSKHYNAPSIKFPQEKGFGTEFRELAAKNITREDKKLKPALLAILDMQEIKNIKGNMIIVDRYYHSTYVYQSIVEHIQKSKLRTIIRNGNLPKPDVLIILDLPVHVATRRLYKRKSSQEMKYDKLDKYTMKLIRNEYEKLPDAYIIKATNSEEAVFRTCISIIDKEYKKRNK